MRIAAAAGVAGVEVRRAGSKQNQRSGIAPVQRQLDDVLCVTTLLNVPDRVSTNSRIRLHGDRFRGGADLEVDRHRGRLVGFDLNALLLEPAETLGFDRDGIGADRQQRKDESAIDCRSWVSRVRPVAKAVALIAAPATAAPLGSRTVPAIVPVGSAANAAIPKRQNAAAGNNRCSKRTFPSFANQACRLVCFEKRLLSRDLTLADTSGCGKLRTGVQYHQYENDYAGAVRDRAAQRPDLHLAAGAPRLGWHGGDGALRDCHGGVQDVWPKAGNAVDAAAAACFASTVVEPSRSGTWR